MFAATCPSREELFDYAVGRLSDEASEGVAEHLESCEECQAGLATFDDADDTLVARLRSPAVEDPCLEESQCGVAIDRARAVAGRGVSRLPLGEELGEYRLLEELGRGGMGTVYKALQTKLDRVVALKVLPEGRIEDDRAVARFEREMKAVGRLDHPNIVRAYDAREIDGKPVLVMEYVEGLDLGKLVRRLGPLPVADGCELARQAALGLQYAHEHGLVHRDVKPSNLMLTPQGEVKVLDLGLARFHREQPAGEEMTGTGQAMGTADYMAPEQTSDSRAVDVRADVYSLGCTLYKLLSGRAPFGGPEHQGTFEKMTAHVQEPVPPIGQLDVDVPDELAAVLDRMLAKDRDERFATPAEVAEALKPFCIDCDLAGLSKRAEEAQPIEDTDRPRRSAPASVTPSQARAPEPQPLSGGRRVRRWVVALGLMLFGGALGMALGILITINHDGQTTTIEVPDKSHVEIGADGNAEVTLPDGSGQPPAAAKSDYEAIQGTWEIVSYTQEPGFSQLLRLPGTDLGHATSDADAAEIRKTGKVIITKDTMKIQEKHLLTMANRYQINPRMDPKWIDVQLPFSHSALGVYELEGDQLKICLDWGSSGVPGVRPRPAAVWAELGSNKELLVLRRIGGAVIEPDEKLIQGTWEVVIASAKISDMIDAHPDYRRYSAPYGEIAKGRKVVIGRFDLTIKGLPTEKAGPDAGERFRLSAEE